MAKTNRVLINLRRAIGEASDRLVEIDREGDEVSDLIEQNNRALATFEGSGNRAAVERVGRTLVKLNEWATALTKENTDFLDELTLLVKGLPLAQGVSVATTGKASRKAAPVVAEVDLDSVPF